MLLYTMHNIDYTVSFFVVYVYTYTLYFFFRIIEYMCDDTFIFEYCTVPYVFVAFCILHMRVQNLDPDFWLNRQHGSR